MYDPKEVGFVVVDIFDTIIEEPIVADGIQW